jgi:hypothetical protein
MESALFKKQLEDILAEFKPRAAKPQHDDLNDLCR